MAYKKPFTVSKPLALTVCFKTEVKNFTVLNKSGKIFYLREFIEPHNVASFNINEAGEYCIVSDSPVIKASDKPIKKAIPIPMPKPDWDYTDGTHKMYLNTQSNSPMSISPRKYFMLIHPKVDTYPVCVQNFIYAHELGHRKYASESLCDLYAINYVLANGGNLTPCWYTLETVLKRSPMKVQRMRDLVNNIQKSNYYNGRK